MRAPGNTLATVDHNVPTSDRSMFESVATFIKEVESQTQVLALEDNVEEFGVAYFGMDDKRQGIVHIIGPEQGFTLPGTTVVCGYSHTATHGAFGALAFGIGTSEVEHVLATQTLQSKKPKNMKIEVRACTYAHIHTHTHTRARAHTHTHTHITDTAGNFAHLAAVDIRYKDPITCLARVAPGCP